MLLVGSIALLVLFSVLGATAFHTGTFGFGFDAGQAARSRTASPAGPIAGLTLLGVLASLAVGALRAQPANAPLDFRIFVRALLYPQTFIALCISPVVFFGALIALDGKELGPPLYLAAFQNGFFWQRVLESKGDGHGAARTGAGAAEPGG